MFFFIDKNVGAAFFSSGLVTILYYEDKFYKLKNKKDGESKECVK